MIPYLRYLLSLIRFLIGPCDSHQNGAVAREFVRLVLVISYCMRTRFSGRFSPMFFDPEIEKPAHQNPLLRSTLKGKAIESTMNPLENQSTPNQQTPQQAPITKMPPMPPPPFTT
ncbi:hypothetical protein Hanom_Chr06g00576281 [Helianthus anomalus]